MSFNLNEYVDVAERIQQFYAKYPDGRLTAGSAPFVLEAGGKPFVVYHARAYRSADDPLPTDGYAWEPVPGPTQFTRDSELMNAETAAWGRAIVALGFATKHIASAQDIQNRGGGKTAKSKVAPNPAGESEKTPSVSGASGDGASQFKAPTPKQKTCADASPEYAKAVKGMWATISEAVDRGANADELKTEIYAQYGVTSTKELTLADVKAITAGLKLRVAA